jgi:type I restriction enzyme S subunit
VKAGWDLRRIGDVCEIVNGGTPRTGVPEYWGGTHRWITPAEMGKRTSPYADETERTITDLGLQSSSARPLPPYSVILSSRAPIGHLVINTKPMATNQGCKGLVPTKLIDHKYLFHYLGSIVGLLNDLGTGATFKEISSADLRGVEIPVPPLPDQQRIVGILDEAFAAIATARANTEQNLCNANEVFVSHLRSAFAEAWRTSQLVTLSDLATDITDGDHMPPPKSQGGVPFITIGNIVKDTRRIDFTETFMVPRGYFEALKPNKKPRTGDVLYTVTGSFGIPVIVAERTEFCFQRHIGLVRPKAETNSSWLDYLLLSPQAFTQANDGATGTAQRTVSLAVLRNFEVPKVAPEKQEAMVAELDGISAETERLASIYRRKLAALDDLKHSLLRQAFTGAL